MKSHNPLASLGVINSAIDVIDSKLKCLRGFYRGFLRQIKDNSDDDREIKAKVKDFLLLIQLHFLSNPLSAQSVSVVI